jgi:phage gp36-like protein
MPYITLDDLLTRDSERDLISLTDPAGQAVQLAVVNRAITSAQAEVDSYIGGRLRLPLEPAEITQQIKHFTLLVARFYLYADRKPESVVTEYEQAQRWLRDVAAGKAQTGVVQAPLTTDTVQGATVIAPVRKSMFSGAAFDARYDVPMGPNGSGEFNTGLGGRA